LLLVSLHTVLYPLRPRSTRAHSRGAFVSVYFFFDEAARG
jgi:hypothetical protein